MILWIKRQMLEVVAFMGLGDVLGDPTDQVGETLGVVAFMGLGDSLGDPMDQEGRH